MRLCPKSAGFLIGIKKVDGSKILTQKTCNMWNCSHCSPILKKRWQAHLLTVFKESEQDELFNPNWYFYTMTAHERDRSPQATLKQMQRQWHIMRQLLYDKHKKLGLKISYIRVYEHHKNGAFHLHALVNGARSFSHYYDKRKDEHKNGAFYRMKDHARKNGFGYQFDVQKVKYDEDHHIGYVVAYVVKYLTKFDLTEDDIKGIRRIQCSQNWSFNRSFESTDYDWTHVPNISTGLAVNLVNTGCYVPQLKKQFDYDVYEYMTS